MAQNIEDFLPPIQSAGLNTLKNTSLGGTLAVTGASTFTGVATFTAAPVFNAGRLTSIVTETTGATLTAAQSGSTIVFGSATGMTLTLPAATPGTEYNFVVALKAASGTHAVYTGSTAIFMTGGLLLGDTLTGFTTATFVADGSTHVAARFNGSTSGGSIGTVFKTVCISSTQWAISGQAAGSGVLATPFTTA